MSRAPLFASHDLTTELQRLTGLADGHTVLSQLDYIIDDVRAEFFTRLGVSRLGTLEGFTGAEPPVTHDDYLRLVSPATEQKMIRLQLLSWLTFNAKESSRARKEWNDVSAFRNMTQERRDNEQDRLRDEITTAFGFLSGADTAGETPRVRAANIKSVLDDQYRVVGYSIHADPAYLFFFVLDTDEA